MDLVMQFLSQKARSSNPVVSKIFDLLKERLNFVLQNDLGRKEMLKRQIIFDSQKAEVGMIAERILILGASFDRRNCYHSRPGDEGRALLCGTVFIGRYSLDL